MRVNEKSWTDRRVMDIAARIASSPRQLRTWIVELSSQVYQWCNLEVMQTHVL